MPLSRAKAGVRDLPRHGGLVGRVINGVTRRVPGASFAFAAVLRAACARVGLSPPPTASVASPDDDHDADDAAVTSSSLLLSPSDAQRWRKLCRACAAKSTSRYGSWLLHHRLVHALAQRLAVDEAWRQNAHELEREQVASPLIVLGLPRSHGHYAAHAFARSGLFLVPRQCDTLTPASMMATQRERAFRRHYGRTFAAMHRDFAVVRVLCGDRVDDDLTLHLLSPQSYAWGLLHGLDEYLLECLDEDQTPVYTCVKRVLQLFAWYKRCGQMPEAVLCDRSPTSVPEEHIRYGSKPPLPSTPRLLLYSPFALLSSDALHATFPDARVVWVHRPLAQCVPSLCSALCLHDALYTGKPPSDSQLVTTGEKVLGVFGSGTEHAIAFYGKFDQRRMVHWGSRDVVRHVTRLAGKTLTCFGVDLDYYRRIQMIDGHTEYIGDCRPAHDAAMAYFGLRESTVHAAFRDYVHQFDEFAIDTSPGVTVTERVEASNLARKAVNYANARAIIGSEGLLEPEPLLPPPVHPRRR